MKKIREPKRQGKKPPIAPWQIEEACSRARIEGAWAMTVLTLNRLASDCGFGRIRLERMVDALQQDISCVTDSPDDNRIIDACKQLKEKYGLKILKG